jgi:hypothetical protein
MTTKITLTNIDSTGDYSELVDSAYTTANAAFAKANTGSSSAGLKLTANSGVPLSANVGDQWWSTTDDILYEYINDGTSNVWIDISSSAITSAVSNTAIIYFPDSIVSNTTFSANTNGLSVGPITIPSGISVTLPTGQRWVIL